MENKEFYEIKIGRGEGNINLGRVKSKQEAYLQAQKVANELCAECEKDGFVTRSIREEMLENQLVIKIFGRKVEPGFDFKYISCNIYAAPAKEVYNMKTWYDVAKQVIETFSPSQKNHLNDEEFTDKYGFPFCWYDEGRELRDTPPFTHLMKVTGLGRSGLGRYLDIFLYDDFVIWNNNKEQIYKDSRYECGIRQALSQQP